MSAAQSAGVCKAGASAEPGLRLRSCPSLADGFNAVATLDNLKVVGGATWERSATPSDVESPSRGRQGWRVSAFTSRASGSPRDAGTAAAELSFEILSVLVAAARPEGAERAADAQPSRRQSIGSSTLPAGSPNRRFSIGTVPLGCASPRRGSAGCAAAAPPFGGAAAELSLEILSTPAAVARPEGAERPADAQRSRRHSIGSSTLPAGSPSPHFSIGAVPLGCPTPRRGSAGGAAAAVPFGGSALSSWKQVPRPSDHDSDDGFGEHDLETKGEGHSTNLAKQLHAQAIPVEEQQQQDRVRLVSPSDDVGGLCVGSVQPSSPSSKPQGSPQRRKPPRRLSSVVGLPGVAPELPVLGPVGAVGLFASEEPAAASPAAAAAPPRDVGPRRRSVEAPAKDTGRRTGDKAPPRRIFAERTSLGARAVVHDSRDSFMDPSIESLATASWVTGVSIDSPSGGPSQRLPGKRLPSLRLASAETVESLREALVHEKVAAEKLRRELVEASRCMAHEPRAVSKAALNAALTWREREMVKIKQDLSQLQHSEGHFVQWEPGFPIQWLPTSPRGPALHALSRSPRRRLCGEVPQKPGQRAAAAHAVSARRNRLHLVAEPDGRAWPETVWVASSSAVQRSPQKTTNAGGLLREKHLVNSREVHVWDWELPALKNTTCLLTVPDFLEEYDYTPDDLDEPDLRGSVC